MLNAFATSFRLKNTYKTNSILYSLKSLPLVKRLLPDALYASAGLKAFANIVSILIEVGSVFVGKLLYVSLMVFTAAQLLKGPAADSFVHIFFFLTIIGGLLNTQIFNPTKDKYYAIFLMRMDARQYTLSNYLYFLLKMAVGLLPFTLLFGVLAGVSPGLCLLMPFFVCAFKLVVTAISLWGCRDGKKARNENLPAPVIWAGVLAALVLAYALPALGLAMSPPLFLALAVLTVIGGGLSLAYVLRFGEFRAIYRTLLDPGSFVMNPADKNQAVLAAYRKKIDADMTQTSSKTGYQYLNELFMKRHSKLLTKSAKKITLVLLASLIMLIIACLSIPEAKTTVNELMLAFLPYFLFVMYLVNRGRVITQAMFTNCDHSMLTYRFYRQPKAILTLFAARLKYIIAINLMPASVIALGLPLLLFLSGGTSEPLNYVLLFVSIIAMSVFFSVHTLVLYYLLQPYNIQMETKNAAYGILNGLTYFVCYFAMGKELPTLAFGLGVSAFCIVYVAAALLLVYRFAPKTFRLRP